VQKTGELKVSNIKNFDKEELYKKCNFKKSENFIVRTTWKNKKSKYDFSKIELYAKNDGKANTENKYDFPPPVDNDLYFGSCMLIAYDNEENPLDLELETWESFYENLFGGFENLNNTEEEDENEIDELDNIPEEMKTKEGYLKDGFIVDDDDETNSELSFEEYEYSE
jgi:hypothetical protein